MWKNNALGCDRNIASNQELGKFKISLAQVL
jgi:hypothetical protein